MVLSSRDLSENEIVRVVREAVKGSTTAPEVQARIINLFPAEPEILVFVATRGEFQWGVLLNFKKSDDHHSIICDR